MDIESSDDSKILNRIDKKCDVIYQTLGCVCDISVDMSNIMEILVSISSEIKQMKNDIRNIKSNQDTRSNVNNNVEIIRPAKPDLNLALNRSSNNSSVI